MKIEFFVYNKWSDFMLNIFPCVYIGHEGSEFFMDKDTYIGFGWLWFALEIHW